MKLITGEASPHSDPSSPHLQRAAYSTQEIPPPTYAHTQKNKRRKKTSIESASRQMTQRVGKGEQVRAHLHVTVLTLLPTPNPSLRVLSHCRNRGPGLCQSEFPQVTQEISHHVAI